MMSHGQGDSEEKSMSLVVSLPSVISFLTGLILLSGYSCMDLKHRKVPNRFIAGTATIGVVVVLLTGEILENWIVYLSATSCMLVISYLLFHIGAMGGADAKASLVVGLVSPGLMFGSLGSPVFEGVLISCLEILVMMGIGYGVYRCRENCEDTIPLIPALLIGYLSVQLLAML